MSSHEKAHCNDFKNHLTCIYDQENKIDLLGVLGQTFNFLVNCQEEAIDNNNNKDKSIKPRVDSNKLNYLVSKTVRNREAA